MCCSKEANGRSSAQLVYGHTLVLPGELKDVAEVAAEDFISMRLELDELPM